MQISLVLEQQGIHASSALKFNMTGILINPTQIKPSFSVLLEVRTLEKVVWVVNLCVTLYDYPA